VSPGHYHHLGGIRRAARPFGGASPALVADGFVVEVAEYDRRPVLTIPRQELGGDRADGHRPGGRRYNVRAA